MSESFDFEGWLEGYRRAWMTRDASAAGQLFTEDALYHEQAFQPPMVGRAAIEQYWRTVTATQSDIDLRYGRRVSAGRTLAVDWWVTLQNSGAPLTLAGAFLLSFTEAGLCRELREYWIIANERIEPPDVWKTTETR